MAFSKQDLSFREDRIGNMVPGKRGSYILGVVQMLFAMRPGTDEYDIERGLDINSKLFQGYANNTRDTEYEGEITRQFTEYTDIIPVDVIAVFKDSVFYVYLSVSYQDQIYQLDVTAAQDSLSAVLRNSSPVYNR